MPRKKTIPKRSRVGRPKIAIDWKLVNRMLQAGCEGTSIAMHIGCGPETLYARVEERYGINFSVYAQARAAEGKEMLRSKQFELALKGNTPMLIWLGKNVLNQRDRSELAVTKDEAKENFVLLLPHDGRSEQALLPEAEDAIIIPEEERASSDEESSSLFDNK